MTDKQLAVLINKYLELLTNAIVGIADELLPEKYNLEVNQYEPITKDLPFLKSLCELGAIMGEDVDLLLTKTKTADV